MSWSVIDDDVPARVVNDAGSGRRARSGSRSRRALLASAIVVACGGSEPGPPAAPPAPAPAPVIARDAEAFAIPKDGAIVLPATYIACAADADCTIATLGCCDETPVRRDHADEIHAALETSGRRYCAVKTACGPGLDGTWNGEPGRCEAGRCVMPRQ